VLVCPFGRNRHGKINREIGDCSEPLVVFAPFRNAIPDGGFLFEPWRGLCRQMGTGGLHCPVLIQRRLALFSLAALCVSGLF